MKGYGEYKETGAQWLGTIPSHWKNPQLREVLEERKEKVSDKEFSPLSVCKAGIVPQLSTAAKSNAGDNRKGVRTGDFVINSRSDRRGSSGISKYEGSVSLISHVLCPRGDVAGSFLDYLLRSHSFIEEFYRNGRGIVADLWTTRFDEMKAITLPIPPREEQDQIVRYLDAKVSKINKLIRIKQQQIALLKEKKQAIINQAVTKGLDPNAPMKDSGIAWIGQIPEGWEVVRFKHLLTRIDQGVSPQAEARLAAPGEWGVLKSGCVNYGVFRETEHKALPYGYVIDESLSVHVGDMLISRACGSAHLVGSVGIVSDLNYKLILCDKIFRPRFYEDGVKLFCCHAMNSSYFRGQIKEAISGAEGLANNLPVTKLKSFIIALPSTSICHEICDYLKERFLNLDSISKQLLQEIATLTEYRTRLISDVVTGKVDVRNLPIPDCEHAEFDGTENPMPNKDVTRENNTESEDE